MRATVSASPGLTPERPNDLGEQLLAVAQDLPHLDRVASELLVSSGHLCQDHPALIREVRRILVEPGIP